jgi:hypothetical protein
MHFTAECEAPSELKSASSGSNQNVATMAVIGETQVEIDFNPEAPVEV